MDSLSSHYRSQNNQAIFKKGSVDVNTEIKLIEKKIRQCKKKIEDEKRRKILEGNCLFIKSREDKMISMLKTSKRS